MYPKSNAVSIIKTKAKQNNNLKSAKIRRQRGYHWEDTIVKRFNNSEGWNAFRLGSPSTGLPDVLAVNTKQSALFTIEAKSGTAMSLPVPADQIERCQKWIKTFDIYKNRHVILAFKFLSKKRIGLGKYENRELREFFKVWDEKNSITDCVCAYDGQFYAMKEGKREKMELKECNMPFKTRHPSA